METISSKELRTLMKEKRNALSLMDISYKSEQIADNISKSQILLGKNKILCFYPLNNEVNLLNLYEDLLHKGYSLYFPRTEGKAISFYRINNLIADFSLGCFKVMEPKDLSDKLTDFNNCACITPGLAFDLACNRIGYGGGYYDRFFAGKDKREILKVGVAFDFQVLNHIEAEPHDIKLDSIVTNTDIIWRE